MQKEKRRTWIFGRIKVKRLASLTAPSVALKENTVSEAGEEQTNHAVTVAIATAAAAEAAVAAVHAAAEVVRLTSTPRAAHTAMEQTKQVLAVETQTESTRPTHQVHDKETQESAAVKIQTAFRGYLVSFNLFLLTSLTF